MSSKSNKPNKPKDETVEPIVSPAPDKVADAPVEEILEGAPAQPVITEKPFTVEVPAVEAAWGVDTWVEVSKARIGVEKYVMRAALRNEDQSATFTERQVRALVEKMLNTPSR